MQEAAPNKQRWIEGHLFRLVVIVALLMMTPPPPAQGKG